MSDVPETHNDSKVFNEATPVPNHPLVSKVSIHEVETKEQIYNTRALSSTATTYELEKFEKNILLIFNHETFDTGHKMRNGTDKDVAALTASFENCRFEVVPYNDLTKKQMFDTLKKFSEMDFTDYGCIAIAVLTHGAKGILRAKDCSYNEMEIWKHFKISEKPTLVTKPRILIVEACRGDENCEGVFTKPGNKKIIEKDGDEKEEEPYCIPEEADIIATHSSFFGYPSFRENPDGTWFIQTLCKKINELADTQDLESILREVKKEIAIVNKYDDFKPEKTDVITQKQMPVFTTTLIRKLYLRKYLDDTMNVEPSQHVGLFENDSQMAADKFSLMGQVGFDSSTIEHQLTELASYKEEVMTKVDKINRKAAESDQRSVNQRQIMSRKIKLMALGRNKDLQLKKRQGISSFCWDEWKKRFLAFVNNDKSLLFRRFCEMDKYISGVYIPEFINIFNNSGFGTSPQEMNEVVHIFDKNNTGLIDWDEFVSAINPSWIKKGRFLTDTDIIKNKIKTLLKLCTCPQKYRVHHVSGETYNFGASQSPHLVRKLGGSILVQASGRETIEEFFNKNDPCRDEVTQATPPSLPSANSMSTLPRERTNASLTQAWARVQTPPLYRSNVAPTGRR